MPKSGHHNFRACLSVIKTILFPLLGIALLLYSIALIALYFYQQALIFPATKLPKNYSFSYNYPFEEVTIPVDGAELHALHFKQENPKGLIFFLHGNAGNVNTWATDIEYYKQVNYDLFMLDYRGYGKSTGKIQSQAQLMNDMRIAWDTVAPQYADKEIVIYGRSLGTALATSLAREVDPALLILVSAFSSMIEVAHAQYPFVPAWLLRYPLRTDQNISEVSSEIVFMHGNKDQLIPIEHSHRLQSLTQKPSTMLTIDGAAHNDIHHFQSYLDGLASALLNRP
jgi:pimeloyl-ACP methyl ester carboxylesterase